MCCDILKKITFFSVALCLSLLFSVIAHSGTIKVNNLKTCSDLGATVEFYEDPAGELSFREVIQIYNRGEFQSSNMSPLNFGYTPSTYWLSFSFCGDTSSKSGWVLDIPYAPLDFVTLYMPNGNGGYKIKHDGDKNPFNQKDIEYKNPVFILGSELIPFQEYFIKVSSDGALNLPISVWTGAGFAQHINKTQTGIGIYLGIVVALLLYNTFLYVSVRDKDFLLCNVVITSYVLVHGSYSGLSYMFLWPNAVWWANNSLVILATVLFISIAVFTKSFLKLKANSPVLDKLMIAFVGYFAFCAAGLFLFDYRTASVMIATVGVFLILVVFLSALYVYSKGYIPSRFFLLAWTFYLVGLTLLLLKLLGVLPHTFVTEYSGCIGFTITALFLSFALSDRVNMLRRQKEYAQQQAMEHLEESERVKTQFLTETEYLVEERTKELENANKQLEELASKDILTGLANRRVFNEEIEKELRRAIRGNKEIALLLIDIDYFKNYNDYYGHLDGDECLRRISEIFKSCVSRSTDVVARYGGEEFAVILCETDMNGAMKIAESLRKSVEDEKIEHKTSPIGYVTVSCGVAAIAPGPSDTSEELINSADMALYKAKSIGRNKVISSSF
jgi:diguanylate cyclase